MIRIQVNLEHGVIRSIESLGHAASVDSVSSVPCTAVSTTLRTFLKLCVQSPNVEAEGDAPEPGRLWIRVVKVSEANWFHGVSDTVLLALRDIAHDFPDELELMVE